MKQAMKMMITAMVAIAMVFSALVIVLPGGSQASSVDDQGTIMFNVIGTDGYFIDGATWVLKNTEGAPVATGQTSNGGLGQTGLVPLDVYILQVSKSGKDVTSNVSYDPDTGFSFEVVTLDLNSSKTGIMGYLSELVPGTTVQVFDHSYNQQTVVLTGNSFHADAADGTYVVLVRVPGYLPVMVNITYADLAGLSNLVNTSGSSIAIADDNQYAIVADLDAREAKMDRVTKVTFGADYNNFSYQRADNNTFEHSQGALSDSELPIRMQIDKMGVSDGNVSEVEVNAFRDAIKNLGWMPVTNNFLKVSTIPYQVVGEYNVTLTGLTGSAYSTDNYQIIRINEYESSSHIDADKSDYSSSLTTIYDTADVNSSYIIDLPDEYELNSQVSKTQYVKIESTDYNLFTVDPLVRSGQTSELVSMTYSMAGVPTASGSVDSSDYAYAVNENNVLQHYIVGKGQVVIFNASASVDSNGNPLANYIWNFGDGTPEENITAATVQHTFADANSTGYNVTLKVINHNGNLSEQVGFKVLVDGKNPEATLTLVTENPTNGSSVLFSGMNSTDDISSAGDGLGIIAKWIWNFGDDSVNVTKTSDNGNVSHAFTASNIYSVNLTVVDVAGNSHTKQLNVTVQRSEMPSLSIQSVKFSPEIFEEGTAGIISVVVKNTGTWEAESFTVNVYKVVGTETEFLTSEVFTDSLLPGENVTVNVSYTFDAQGEYRLKVTVEDDDPRTSNSNDYSSLTVSEAGWKNIAIFAGVIVVIGIIVALVYYRNRLPGKNAFKKGGAPAKQDKTLPKMEESASLEEPKKKAPSAKGGKSKKR